MYNRKITFALLAISIAALIAFISLLAYSFTGKYVMTMLFAHVSYYFIVLILIVWIVQGILLLNSLDFSSKHLLKQYWLGLLIALTLTIAVFSSVRIRFKTLSDETNLLAVSNSMFNDKTCFNHTAGLRYYNNFNAINSEIPKRPLVFPFLVSLLHSFTGFRYQNPFVLNFIVMFLFLSGIYITTRKFSDVQTSIAAMFLVLSYPVFTIFGTSGGFDFLNGAFFMLIIAATYYFIKKPSAVSFAFIFASLIVFANIRYESVIFLFAIPILLIKKIKLEYLKKHYYLFCITPLVSLPCLWQRILKHGSHSPTEMPLFSPTSFLEHITLLFQSLFDTKYFLPYAGLLTLISLSIFIYLLIEILRKKIKLQDHQKYFAVVCVLLIFIAVVIYFAHYSGIYTHPSTARFFIILSIILALLPIVLKVMKPNIVSGTTLLILSVACFVFYHPIAVEGRFINTLTLNRRTEHCIEFLNKLDNENILVIAPRPGQYTALGYGAVSFGYANSNYQTILYQASRHLYTRIIVFQQILYQNEVPTQDTTLDVNYKLKTLYEIQVDADRFLRIAEVIIPQK